MGNINCCDDTKQKDKDFNVQSIFEEQNFKKENVVGVRVCVRGRVWKMCKTKKNENTQKKAVATARATLH